MEDGESRLPGRLSPSRAQDFIDCPKKFHYKTIEGLVEPPTIHTARGTIAHTALELLFDLPRGERTEEAAVALVEPAWHKLIEPDLGSIEEEYLRRRAEDDAVRYKDQVAAGAIDVEELIATATIMVRNYFHMEDPNGFEPEARELRVAAEAAGVPLHGIIDRLDKVAGEEEGEGRWYISDYKTAGKIPSERYMDSRFFAMRVYALLVKEQMGIQVTGLRLIYLKGAKPEAIKYQAVTEQSIEATRRQMKALWQAIKDAERRDVWPTKTGPLCNWCHFMDICPAWAKELDGVETVAGDNTAAAGGADGRAAKGGRRSGSAGGRKGGASGGRSGTGTRAGTRTVTAPSPAAKPPAWTNSTEGGAIPAGPADDILLKNWDSWGGPDDRTSDF